MAYAFCNKCGHRNPPESLFCSACGTSLDTIGDHTITLAKVDPLFDAPGPADDVQIDLGHLVMEQLHLALPMKPLCSETCKGLCPQCGTNLNTGSCNCDPRWEDPRLAALKALKESNFKKG